MILTPFLMDLGKVIHAMRPDWPLPSIHRALCSCGERTEAEIALAAVRVASDKESKSPTRMTLAGPWWDAVDFSKPSVASVHPLPPPYRREHVRAVPMPKELYDQTKARLRAARPSEGDTHA